MGQAGVSVLLDSVVLIDHFNGIEQATKYLAEVHRRSAVSVITRAEVLAGFDDVHKSSALSLLDALPTIGIDKATADVAAALRRHHGWKLPDAFQAAIASMGQLKLATRNTKDFPPARHDFVLVPYTL
jgi:predicted nucleic acid-binding protein